MDKRLLKEAHKYCRNNRPLLEKDSRCGCFYCSAIFNPEDIKEWIEGEPAIILRTAVCPHCGVDAVLSESAGYPLAKVFLSEMEKFWFE